MGRITDLYQKNFLLRFDKDGAIPYYSGDDFPGLVCERGSFRNTAGVTIRSFTYAYEGYDPNKLEEAKDTDRKIIALSVCTCLFFGAALAVAAPFIPRLYNTGDEVKTLATRFLWVSACMMPFNAFTHACYFTLRSGGQTRITMLFDSCFVWALCIPVAFVLSRFTALPILPLYLVCCSLELVKCVIGVLLVKSNRWVVNIVRSEDADGEQQPA